MRLPDQAINEFRELWRQHFGQELKDDEARRHAEKVLAYTAAVYAMPCNEPLNPKETRI
jgi:hypothetical protein